jgi:hypothetical protein
LSIFCVDNMSGFVHFLCGRYERVDEQSVHFHVRLGCSVTVDVVYMGRKIQWTIHVGRRVTRTRRTWTIHHSTNCSPHLLLFRAQAALGSMLGLLG